MSWTGASCPTLFSAALPKKMTGNRVSTVSSCHGRPPPKVTKLWSHTSSESLFSLPYLETRFLNGQDQLYWNEYKNCTFLGMILGAIRIPYSTLLRTIHSSQIWSIIMKYEQLIAWLLSPSGDLGIGLVWDNPTPPDRLFGPTVEILWNIKPKLRDALP